MLELVIEGLIGEIISSGIETTKDKIKNAIEKCQHKSVNTEIYQVIVDSLNCITCNEYKNNQDKIYESAELLLKSFKEERKDEMKSIKSCLKDICSSVSDDTCAIFKDMLYGEICKEEHSELYRRIRLFQQERKNYNDRKEMQQINEKLDKGNQMLSEMRKQNDEKIVITQEKKFQNNKKQDYIDNWNSRLFLHQDKDKRPITLADAFIMPDYDMYCSNSRIGISENDTLDQAIECFIDYDKTSTMLLTGVPGIGKSSITSWIANKYKDDDRVIILRFRDWEPEELEKGIIKAVCSTLECKKRELNSKILVLDGFDEMKSLDKRQQLLNVFLVILRIIKILNV